MTERYLQHYGVLGMKWGVRHERKSDGSVKKTKKRVNYVTKKSYANDTIATVGRTLKAKAIYGGIGVAGLATNLPLTTVAFGIGLTGLAVRAAKNVINYKSGKDTTHHVLNKIRDSTCKPAKLSSIRKLSESESLEDSVASVNKWSRFKTGSQNNCVNSSIAIDMRRRGYDVSARYNNDGIQVSLLIDKIYKGASLTKVTTTGKTAQARKNQFFSELEKQGDGARGIAMVNGDVNHAMYYENVNGETRIYDGQKSNRTAAIWSRNLTNAGTSRPRSMSYVRLDTCTPTDYVNYLVTDGDVREKI